METNAKLPVVKLTLAFIFAQVSAQQQQKKKKQKREGKICFERCCNQANENKWQPREGAPQAGERDGEKEREKDRKLIAFPLIYL